MLPIGLVKPLVLVIGLSAISGCAILIPTSVTVRATCSIWQGISWEDSDTDQTISEIKINNARRDAFCKGVN